MFKPMALTVIFALCAALVLSLTLNARSRVAGVSQRREGARDLDLQLAGRGLELSPAIVFISMIFWGYFLGGSGVIVAVPLTVFIKMILESYPETRHFALLFGTKLNEISSDCHTVE